MEHSTGQPEPTGERFVPELMSGQLIDAEHQVRYRFALAHVGSRRVLDAGCGVGWGSELIVEAGAAEVVGVDNSAEALTACRARGVAATFVQADLGDLPFADDTFDVVVCFEALEHTQDTNRTLDELVRVLRPAGILFVSSPNPAIYPPGNPFHIYEVPPDELRSAVGKRLREVRLFRQHQHLSSLIYPDVPNGPDAAPARFTAEAYPVQAIAPGHDPYGIVVASDGQLPALDMWLTLAPSSQLDNLGALAAVLAEEREALHSDHARIAADWVTVTEQLTDAQDRLRVAGETMEALLRGRDEVQERLRDAGETIKELLGQRDDALQTVSELGTRAQALSQQLERQRLVAANAATERDELGMRLIAVEQQLAQLPDLLAPAIDQAALASLHERLDALNESKAQRDAELDAIRATVSWRVTRPLRTVRTLMGRAGRG